MLCTIAIGSHVSVQGILVGKAQDGKVIVRVDDKHYVGYSVSSKPLPKQ